MGCAVSKKEDTSMTNKKPNSNNIIIGGENDAYAQLEDKGNELFFKVLLLGDSGVGKSSILSMFCDDKFNFTHISTVGVDFKTVHLTIQDKQIQLQIWDTAGQERYRSIITAYYRGAHGIFLIFDLTKRETFENIRRWLTDVSKHAHQSVKTILIGNKKDLDHIRTVSTEEAEQLAKELGVKYFEVR
ncbi:hypothetical protein ABK040_000770 [Willaertia magna]